MSLKMISQKVKRKKVETPKQPHRGVEDLLGQPSGKFNFYSKPASNEISLQTIMPTGWGDEFEDEDNEGYNVWIDNTEVNHGHQEQLIHWPPKGQPP